MAETKRADLDDMRARLEAEDAGLANVVALLRPREVEARALANNLANDLRAAEVRRKEIAAGIANIDAQLSR